MLQFLADLLGPIFAKEMVDVARRNRSIPAGLAATLLFPLLIGVATAALIGVFEEEHAYVLWPLSVLFLAASLVWIHRSLSCAAVSCFLTAVHLALGCLVSFWTTDGRRDEYPVAVMHPGFLTVVMMDNHLGRELHEVPWFVLLPLYWGMLVVNIVWARWWLIRHFDRLAGRPEGPTPGAAGALSR